MQLKVLNSNQFVSSNLSAVDCECDVEKIFLATQVRQRCYDIIPVVVPSKAKKLFWVIGSHACFANFNFGQILSLKFQYDTVLLNFVFKLSALIFHLTLLMHFQFENDVLQSQKNRLFVIFSSYSKTNSSHFIFSKQSCCRFHPTRLWTVLGRLKEIAINQQQTLPNRTRKTGKKLEEEESPKGGRWEGEGQRGKCPRGLPLPQIPVGRGAKFFSSFSLTNNINIAVPFVRFYFPPISGWAERRRQIQNLLK